jgi:hypothetical protein
MRRRQHTRFVPPTYRGFPHECKTCGCCGHNRSTHAAFMAAFPAIDQTHEKCWRIGNIAHQCMWCRDYATVYKAHNEALGRPPRRPRTRPLIDPHPLFFSAEGT